MCLVLIPISVYFYLFHGDWFLLYLVDVRLVPSAIALVGFVVEGLIASLGFFVGASFIRSQRDGLALLLSAAAIVLAGSVPLVAKKQLQTVATYSQFHGNFGGAAFQGGPLFQGTVAMSVFLVSGFVYLIARLHWSGRRS